MEDAFPYESFCLYISHPLFERFNPGPNYLLPWFLHAALPFRCSSRISNSVLRPFFPPAESPTFTAQFERIFLFKSVPDEGDIASKDSPQSAVPLFPLGTIYRASPLSPLPLQQKPWRLSLHSFRPRLS